MIKEFNIGIIPETPEEEFENACQQVANLTDDPEWSWLAPMIADQALSWSQIFDVVAKNS